MIGPGVGTPHTQTDFMPRENPRPGIAEIGMMLIHPSQS